MSSFLNFGMTHVSLADRRLVYHLLCEWRMVDVMEESWEVRTDACSAPPPGMRRA